MHKFYERLKSLGKRAWAKVKDNFVTRFISRTYMRSLERSAGILGWAYNNDGWRNRFFNTGFGMRALLAGWSVIATVGMVFFPIKDGLKLIVLGVGLVLFRAAQVVAFTLAVAWALLSLAFTVVLALFVWAMNALRHGTVTAWRYAWHRTTKGKRAARPAPLTRYAPIREAMAYYLGGLMTVHSGGARLFRRLIGDSLCWFMIKHLSNATARLHPPTYDFWFGSGFPFDYVDEEDGQYRLFIADGVVEDEDPISEREKAEIFYLNSGFVLIAHESGAPKSDKDVFNEYVNERWAHINAAEIATDEWGRTWAVPKKGEPLIKPDDVSTGTKNPRPLADGEMAWMTEKDPKARAYGYGRHWAAALLDQGCGLLSSEETLKRERATLFAKARNGQLDMPVEHVLRGFDSLVIEQRQKLAESTTA